MHEDEIEISPFKSRVSIPHCRECGTPLVSARVGEKIMALLSKEYPEDKTKSIMETAMLCPECKRKKVGEVVCIST
jgi:hypothetical protein